MNQIPDNCREFFGTKKAPAKDRGKRCFALVKLFLYTTEGNACNDELRKNEVHNNNRNN